MRNLKKNNKAINVRRAKEGAGNLGQTPKRDNDLAIKNKQEFINRDTKNEEDKLTKQFNNIINRLESLLPSMPKARQNHIRKIIEIAKVTWKFSDLPHNDVVIAKERFLGSFNKTTDKIESRYKKH